MKKGIWVVIGLVLAAVAGYVAAGPYITLSEIRAGFVEQNSEKLSENIDFPTLRQNMKEQFNAVLMKNAATELKDDAFAAIGTALATELVDGIVDSIVTPSGLVGMMEGKNPFESIIGETSVNITPKKEDLFKNARYSYDSMSKFSVWIPNDKGEEGRFVLKRDGLSWNLVNLVLPMN